MHPAQAELADPAFLLLIPPVRAGGKQGVPYLFLSYLPGEYRAGGTVTPTPTNSKRLRVTQVQDDIVRVVQGTSIQKVHHSPPLGLKSRKSLDYPCAVIKVCLPFTVVSKAELLAEVNLESQGPSLLCLNGYTEPEVLHSLLFA